MQKNVGAVIMIGPARSTPVEQLLDRATCASVLDLLDALRDCGTVPIVVAGPDLGRLQSVNDIIFDEDRVPFEFGTRFAELIERYQLETLLYFGAGSTPLLGPDMVGLLVAALDRAVGEGGTLSPRLALTNNLHSSDWLGLASAQGALEVIRTTDRDNSLAWSLQSAADYEIRLLPSIPSAAGMDLDTPTDLAIARRHPLCRPRLRAALEDSLLDRLPVEAIVETAGRTGSSLALIGRVSPGAWEALSNATQAWIRVFSEERGMVASMRLERGEVRSLLARLLELLGPEGFFRELAAVADAALLDSRVLMAACGHYVGDAERYASDLLLPDDIADPWLREFTAAAAQAPIPILLGGHSVVAGGLHALADIVAAQRRDR